MQRFSRVGAVPTAEEIWLEHPVPLFWCGAGKRSQADAPVALAPRRRGVRGGSGGGRVLPDAAERGPPADGEPDRYRADGAPRARGEGARTAGAAHAALGAALAHLALAPARGGEQRGR